MPPPYVEIDDLVRLPNQTLAIIERLPISSDSESESEDSDDDNEITDARGRLSNWVHEIAFPSPPTNLITAYDDSSILAADDHSHELPALPDAQPYHPHQPIPEGSALITIGLAATQALLPLDSVTPIDRSFEPGTVVIRPNSRQIGFVQSTEKTLYLRRVCDITPSTVHLPDPKTIFQVKSSELGLFSCLRAGDAVVRGNWVGTVDYFQEDVFVQFADGAIACVPGHNKALRNIDSRTPDREDFHALREGLYYPGQRVRAVPEVWVAIAVWIRGKYSGSNEGVVKSVCLGDVGVEWIARNMYIDDAEDSMSLNPMKNHVENVKFQELTPLDAFRESDWVIGDRAFLINRDSFLSSPANCGQSGDGDGVTGLSCSRVSEAESDSEMQDVDNEDDGEWEEDGASGKEERKESGPASSRKGRLMKAYRRARELVQPTQESGVVSETVRGSPGAFAEDVVQIIRTSTKVNVLWQDGSNSEGIPGLELQRPQFPDSLDFWAGQIVSRLDDDLSNDENGVSNPLKRTGIVISMDNNQRTAVVKWESENGTQPEEEELSLYELMSDNSNLGIGDIVLHAPPRTGASPRKEWVGTVTGHAVGKCTVSWYGGKVSDVPHSELLSLGTDGGEDSDDSDSSGEVEEDTSVGEADVHYDDEDDTNWGSEIDDDEGVSSSGVAIGRGTIRQLVDDLRMSQNCRINFMPDNVTLAVQVAVEGAADMLDRRRRRREQEESEIRMSHDDMRLLANFLVTRATSQLLFSSLVQHPELRTNYHSRGEVVREWETLKTALIVVFDSLAKEDECESGDIEMLGDGFVDENREVRETMQMEAPASEDRQNADLACDEFQSSANGTASSANGVDEQTVSTLEKFVVIDDLADFHEFPGAGSSSAPSNRFLSVVNKEWSRLRKSLPDGIYVRASEQNRERVRAAIIGPRDTPYSNIVFFFDIVMGHRYPIEPPQVWFRSYGRNLNPNLYDDGKVCLSILGTWDGDSVESWDAKTSNLLRVLLSLQALVFVDEPYYNEAGYQKQMGTAEGQANSQIYNESTFLGCIKHMIHTLKKGAVPEDCAGIATAHYRTVGREILERCRRLLKWESGNEKKDANDRSCDEPVEAYSSCGFRRSLSGLLANLERVVASLDEAAPPSS